jgi:hypothetical protein
VNCANCGVTLYGRYCADCGQRRDSATRTVGHLAEETIETLTHADSRLWRTLRALLTRPGMLTREYFAGRRARYLPPIRLYLVLSVAFFLLLALDQSSTVDLSSETRIDADCTALEYRGPFEATVRPRLQEACRRLQSQGAASFESAFLRNVPKAMFVLLPLVAAGMLLFYWRPRRIYVEHLLHLVHNQSAIYAALVIEILLNRAIPDGYDGFLAPALLGYLVWYCYRSMRVCYGETRLVSLGKFTAIAFLYLLFAAMLLIFTGIASVLGG